ncbi:MAG: type VI secretion system tip protein VgrG [Proteobacteria bacterium]|nr:type VI secretion system tip protein VgrG [Pseudomonadota bacterium]
MPTIIERDFIFEISGVSFHVTTFTVREKVSHPFEIDISCGSKEEIKFDDVIGKEALLTLSGGPADRYFHGIISRFVHVGSFENLLHYRVTLVPFAWLLSLEKDCRIFQKMDVKEIVSEVLKDGGITADKFDFRLKGSYDKKEYCVQYRETDLNFISRLLEEEGIFYFFEHDKKQHTMIFGDSKVNYLPVDVGGTGSNEIKFHSPDTMGHGEETVYEVFLQRQIRSGKMTLNDFNFQKPSVNLKVDESSDTFQQLEVYDYPGIYSEDKKGKDLAKIRLEERRVFLDHAEGKSECQAFVPGFTFKLTDHHVDMLNQEYLLTEVVHLGSQKQTEGGAAISKGFSYHNEFFCIPSTVTLRPERTSPLPVIEGVQTAIVVGPKGEEIYTDEHGRVKVQFHWDRLGEKNENSSCWIRVSQVWAGAGWGAMHIPRIGQEVIVDFEEGNPDKPLITGRVYHGENLPPYALPDNKTKSLVRSETSLGGGSNNELMMEDKSGETRVVLSSAYGHKIIQDEKTQTTTLETRDKHTIALDDKNQNLKIETTNKHSLLFDDKNKKIALKSKEGHTMEVDDDKQKITTKTKKGHKFEFDDDKNKIELLTVGGHKAIVDDDNKKISIKSATGHHVTLDDDGDAIVVEDAKGNKITLEAGSTITVESGGDINIKAPKGKIALEAMEIMIKADTKIDINAGMELKMEGGMTLNAKGGVQAKMEGAMCEVKGGAMTKIAGGVVMIN